MVGLSLPTVREVRGGNARGHSAGVGPLPTAGAQPLSVDPTGARPLNPADLASFGAREGPCWAGPRHPGFPESRRRMRLPSPGIGEWRAPAGRWPCSEERSATHEVALGASPALAAGSPHPETQTPASGLKRGAVFQTVSGEIAGGCLTPLPLFKFEALRRIRHQFEKSPCQSNMT
ncbi:uncharacterized protein LOC112133849 [Pongo abelii]|uniref:uncharacterized protein LOC112133849 n=1 Tax=Pongo abelii TaxID=9601 RepID=UPI00300464C1